VTPAQRRLAAAKMAEAELQEQIRTMCAGLGLAVQHIHDPRRSWLPGWPDLVIIGNRVLWRELKSETGSLSPDQRRVGSLITRAGGNWSTWRPRDLMSGVIARQLQEIAGVQAELFGETA
jgi:hypothetical protein